MHRKREMWGDILRCVATFLIISIHISSNYYYTYFSSGNVTNFLILRLLTVITRAAVPVFFMLTGAFALRQYVQDKSRPSLNKTIKRLVIPFVIFSIIDYLYNTLSNNSPINPLDFIQSFLSSGGIQYHMWFMYSIIVLYLFMPFIVKFVKSLPKKDLLKLIILNVIFGNVLHTTTSIFLAFNINIFNGINLPGILVSLNYLLIGYYLNTYKLSKRRQKILLWAGVISAIAMPLTELIYFGNPNQTIIDRLTDFSSLYSLFLGISMFILFKYKVSKITLPNKLSRTITKISSLTFYIYMIHVTILVIIQNTTSRLNLPGGFIYKSIISISQLLITFIISLVIAYLFDVAYKFILRLTDKKLITRVKDLEWLIMKQLPASLDS